MLRLVAFFILFSTLAVDAVHASTALPDDFTLEGRLYDKITGLPLNTSVGFRITIFDETDTNCVLYREVRPSVDLSATDATAQGLFSLRLGSVAADYKNTSFTALFAPGTFTGVGGCQVVAANGSHRLVHLEVKYPSENAYEALTPDTKLTSVPTAQVAENALALQGIGTSSLLLLNGSTALQQTNFEYLFTTANHAKLKSLVDGGSSQYIPSSPIISVDFNAQRLINVADPVSGSDVATKQYADLRMAGQAIDITAIGPMTGDGAVMQWDQTGTKWLAAPPNRSPTGLAGGDLTGTYPNPTLRPLSITGDKVVDGTIVTSKLIPSTTPPAPNRLLITDAGSGAGIKLGACGLNEVYAWTASGWACATVGSLLSSVNATQLRGKNISAVSPNAGQVLAWNASAPQWEPSTLAVGSVTRIDTPANTGLLGGPITTTGSLIVDAGTAPNKIVQLNSTSQITLIRGSASKPTYSFYFNNDSGLFMNGNTLSLSNSGTTRLAISEVGNVVIGATASGYSLDVSGPARATQLCLGIECRTSWPAGSMTSVTSSNADISVVGTSSAAVLTLNSGTAANQIVKLSTTAQLPAVDGSQLINLNLGSGGYGSQTRNRALMSPDGSNGTPAFRQLALGDLPNGSISGLGTTGWIPYYGTESTLAKSLIFNGTTGIGIGKSNVAASSALDVQGEIRGDRLVISGDIINGALGGYLKVITSNSNYPQTLTDNTGFAVGNDRFDGYEVDLWNISQYPTAGTAPKRGAPTVAFSFFLKDPAYSSPNTASGAVKLASLTHPGKNNNVALEVYGAAKIDGVLTSSDARLKSNVSTLNDALDRILNLRGVSYVWIDPSRPHGQQIGFIAQEVERVFPTVVLTGADGFKSVDYSRLTAPIVEAIKALHAKFVNADDRIERLEAENAALKARLEHIERSLSTR